MIDVVGGVYEEQCLKPQWHEVFGSAGRAASAIAAIGGPGLVRLHSYVNDQFEDVIATRCALEGSRFAATHVQRIGSFHYYHGLATPRIVSPPAGAPSIVVQASRIVRFGMLEGEAVVHADEAVYDPQGVYQPEVFAHNGSTANRLAVVLNDREAVAMTGLTDVALEELAEAVLKLNNAQVVVIKLGPIGAFVLEGNQSERVPAYASDSVWKIGSGDIFVAHFAFRWMHERRPAAESAVLASQATAQFCNSSGFPTPANFDRFAGSPILVKERHLKGYRPTVYLAGPFFTLAQLWIIEQARDSLRGFGLEVFSPYHDVGHGSADDVVELDLDGIRKSDIMFAIGDGLDSGTIYEIGYARARNIPVVMYCENESRDNQKMMEGSGCILCSDYVSAIYKTLWVAMSS